MKLLNPAIALLLPAAFAAEAGAQTLAKEIVVEKEIVPEEREASRITMLPQLQLPAVTEKSLSWTDRPVAAPVTTSIEILAPSGYLSSMPRPDSRGYVTLGYFPVLEAGVTAGYRFIDTEATTLGITAAYEGSSYKAHDLTGLRRTYRDHTGGARVYLRQEAGSIGTLTADIAGLFSAYNRPLPGSAADPSLKASDFNAGIGWNSSVGSAAYYVKGRFNRFAFSDSGVGESMGRFDLGFSLPFNERLSVGADADITFLSDKVGDPGRYTFAALNPLDRNTAAASLTPFLRLATRQLTGRIGLYMSAISGRGKGGFDLGPVLNLGWTPTQKFALALNLKSERKPHSVAEEWTSCHYIDPGQFYGYSTILDFDASAIIGPFSGASLTLHASIGKNDGALMPLATTAAPYSPMMSSVDMSTSSFGGAFDYRYGRMASLHIGYEIAPNDRDSGLADRTDRARGVLDASLTVSPIDQLDLTLGYESRTGRRIYRLVTETNLPPFFGDTYTHTDLGNVNDLRFGFTWRTTEKLTVWGRAGNLMNRHWTSPWLRPCKGVTGLIGAALKF